ncbi:MAG: Hpt domain-containing protein, partial [Firmicutes bacterium]|nr:Hpt domain-containing protein [Bacillota bacterium]
MADFDRESMLEMFIFEMSQLVEQLEQTVVQSETEYNKDQINEIFRIMHTIKGSSAMMMFDDIARVAHVIEDLFYYLREESPQNVDYSGLSDLVLEGADFVKVELVKIQEGGEANGDPTTIAEAIRNFLTNLKNPGAASAAPAAAATAPPAGGKSPAQATGGGTLRKYKAKITFEDGCEMENIRAYTLVHNLMDYAQSIKHIPEDVIDEDSIEVIRSNGFFIDFTSTKTFEEMEKHLLGTVYLDTLKLEEEDAAAAPAEVAVEQAPAPAPVQVEQTQTTEPAQPANNATVAAGVTAPPAPPVEPDEKKTVGPAQHVISVNVNKLDALLNLMGELVISEAMVTQNSELADLQLDSFHKEARQLRK